MGSHLRLTGNISKIYPFLFTAIHVYVRPGVGVGCGFKVADFLLW